MDFSTDLTDALVTTAIALIPVLGAILLFYLRGLLVALEGKAKAELGDKQYYMLTSFADTVIEAAEQTITGGKSKKEFAANMFRQLCDKYGVDITDEQISALIEAAIRSSYGWRNDVSQLNESTTVASVVGSLAPGESAIVGRV